MTSSAGHRLSKIGTIPENLGFLVTLYEVSIYIQSISHMGKYGIDDYEKSEWMQMKTTSLEQSIMGPRLSLWLVFLELDVFTCHGCCAEITQTALMCVFFFFLQCFNTQHASAHLSSHGSHSPASITSLFSCPARPRGTSCLRVWLRDLLTEKVCPTHDRAGDLWLQKRLARSCLIMVTKAQRAAYCVFWRQRKSPAAFHFDDTSVCVRAPDPNTEISSVFFFFCSFCGRAFVMWSPNQWAAQANN